MSYQCVNCQQPLVFPLDQAGEIICQRCEHRYHYDKRYLKYEFDALLHNRFRRQFLLSKALNNNGYLSYMALKEGSLSLPNRQDVQNFRTFITRHVPGGKVLDVGCGLLPLPGYLAFDNRSDYDLFGLDPIDDRQFEGNRIVGCSEFMPFADASFDALIYATSLDHVVSLEKTLQESRRILKPGGKLLIWMSDRTLTFYDKYLLLKGKIGRLIGRIPMSLENGYQDGPYVVYPNGTVLYVPRGAVDPFHAFKETPQFITRKMKHAGFKRTNFLYNHRNEVFLCFEPELT